MASIKGQGIDLESLSPQQLSQVKKQLDDELEHLTNSFSQLRNAQAKFRECLKAMAAGMSPKLDQKQILVPLTTSLYVPGVLSDTENVIVDAGTGFYVEKRIGDAIIFYNQKVDDLSANLKDLEAIVHGKSNNLRVVEEILRQKVLNSSTS